MRDEPRANLTIGTTLSYSVLLPPQAVPAPLPWDRVPMGMMGRVIVNIDPFAAYDDGTIANRHICATGHIGHGKSSWIKTFLERTLTLPEVLPDGTLRLRRAVIIDHTQKHEYTQLAHDFDCEPVVVGHGVCLNPCDDRLPEQQQVGLVLTFLALEKPRPLEPLETRAAVLGFRQAKAKAKAEGRQLFLADVRDAYADLSRGTLAKMPPLVRDEAKRAGVFLALALDDLLDGEHAGMFDGPTTPALDWSKQVTVISVHPDYLVSKRELVYQLVVAVLAVWLDQAQQNPDPHRRIDFFGCDEAWDYVKVPQFAALMQERSKIGRSQGLCMLLAFHGATDADSAGHVGQAQRDIAKRLFRDCGIHVMFNQTREDAELLRGVCGLSDDDIDSITHLAAHCYMLVLGTGDTRRRLVARHVLGPGEWELVKTDKRAA